MTFKQFLPVPVMIGVTAGLWMVVVGQWKISAFPLIPWVPFITWALYFMAGAKRSRLMKEAIGVTGGILAAVAVLLAFQGLSGVVGQGWWVLPLVVFFAAFTIVALEWTNWFELAPAYFFTFAGYFAFLFGGFMGPKMTLSNILWFWVLSLIGLGIGLLTSELRKWILSAQGVPEAEQQTVFDREQRKNAQTANPAQ